MAVKTISKHELKTKETRKLLLQAAETVFTRDGYEGAELGEIATLAGRTKGAIYAQFKSKEDIFLALIDDRRAQSKAQMEELLADSESTEDNLQILRHFYLTKIEEPTWALLLLEFKLFVSRHPKAMKRYQTLSREGLSEASEQRYSGILGPARKGKDAISRVVAVNIAPSILSALALEMKVTHFGLSEAAAMRVAKRLLDALLEISPGRLGAETKDAELARGRNGSGGRKKNGTPATVGSRAAV